MLLILSAKKDFEQIEVGKIQLQFVHSILPNLRFHRFDECCALFVVGVGDIKRIGGGG